jgi:hypothetical protein
MAVVAFPDLSLDKITYKDGTHPEADKYPLPVRFYVLTLSIAEQE